MAGSADWPIKKLPLSKLRLDPQNVRIRGNLSDEDEILAYLFAHEDVLTLLGDIARDGYFDNEQPMAVADGDNFIVLEGNRRVSSLKALANPDRVPSHAPRVRAAAARAEDTNFPTRIRVMVAPDRASALQVIARLHTRTSKKRWIREQQAAFYYDRVREGQSLDDLKREFPAETNIRDLIVVGQMMDRLRAAIASDPGELSFVDSDKFKITTYEYLYDSVLFRNAIGMQITDGRVTITGNSADFVRRLFRQIVIDMRDGRINTRKIKVGTTQHSVYVTSLVAIAENQKSTHEEPTPEDAPEEAPDSGDRDESLAPPPGSPKDEAAEELREDAPPSETDPGSSEDSDADVRSDDQVSDQDAADYDNDAETASPAGDSEPDSTTRRRQRYDQRLDAAGMTYGLASAGMRTRWDELTTLNVRNHPNATFDFIRSFLECLIKDYFAELGDPVTHPRGGNNPVQLSNCLDHLSNRMGTDPVINNGLLRLRTRQRSNPSDYYSSSAALNDSNHEPDAIFNYEQVNQLWAQIKPLIRKLLAGSPSGNQVPQSVGSNQ